MLVSGGTKSGKTTFVKKLLTYVDIMIEKPSENITYYYSEFQNTFGEIQTLVPQIKFVQGINTDTKSKKQERHSIALRLTLEKP